MIRLWWIEAAVRETGLAVVMLAIGLGCAAAQTTASDPAGGLRGEWRRAGAGFGCIVAANERLSSAPALPEMLSRACQHMGPFVIGQDAGDAQKTLGQPHRSVPLPDGQVAWVYFLEQQGEYPYLVVTVAKNTIVALQVSGSTAANGYDFNHIALGLPTKELLARFGSPSHLQPSEEKDTELWNYDPWPFSFEVRDNHVTSIRISKP